MGRTPPGREVSQTSPGGPRRGGARPGSARRSAPPRVQAHAALGPASAVRTNCRVGRQSSTSLSTRMMGRRPPARRLADPAGRQVGAGEAAACTSRSGRLGSTSTSSAACRKRLRGGPRAACRRSACRRQPTRPSGIAPGRPAGARPPRTRPRAARRTSGNHGAVTKSPRLQPRPHRVVAVAGSNRRRPCSPPRSAPSPGCGLQPRSMLIPRRGGGRRPLWDRGRRRPQGWTMRKRPRISIGTDSSMPIVRPTPGPCGRCRPARAPFPPRCGTRRSRQERPVTRPRRGSSLAAWWPAQDRKSTIPSRRRLVELAGVARLEPGGAGPPCIASR